MLGDLVDGGRGAQCGFQRFVQLLTIPLGERLISFIVIMEPTEQAIEQVGVRSGCQRQMEISNIAGRGAPWIDNDDFQSGVTFFCQRNALVDDRVTPGGIGTDKGNQFRLFYILITTRYRVRTKGSLVSSDR